MAEAAPNEAGRRVAPETSRGVLPPSAATPANMQARAARRPAQAVRVADPAWTAETPVSSSPSPSGTIAGRTPRRLAVVPDLPNGRFDAFGPVPQPDHPTPVDKAALAAVRTVVPSPDSPQTPVRAAAARTYPQATPSVPRHSQEPRFTRDDGYLEYGALQGELDDEEPSLELVSVAETLIAEAPVRPEPVAAHVTAPRPRAGRAVWLRQDEPSALKKLTHLLVGGAFAYLGGLLLSSFAASAGSPWPLLAAAAPVLAATVLTLSDPESYLKGSAAARWLLPMSRRVVRMVGACILLSALVLPSAAAHALSTHADLPAGGELQALFAHMASVLPW